MIDKAQIERLTQLTRAAQGKTTKRTPAEIAEAERQAAAKFLPRPPAVKTVETP